MAEAELGVTRVCRGGWKCDRGIDDPAEVHIRPRDDLRWHPLDSACWCSPRIEAIEDADPLGWLVTHDALDGRGNGERPPDG